MMARSRALSQQRTSYFAHCMEPRNPPHLLTQPPSAPSVLKAPRALDFRYAVLSSQPVLSSALGLRRVFPLGSFLCRTSSFLSLFYPPAAPQVLAPTSLLPHIALSPWPVLSKLDLSGGGSEEKQEARKVQYLACVRS